jgi:hypothetical protein
MTNFSFPVQADSEDVRLSPRDIAVHASDNIFQLLDSGSAIPARWLFERVARRRQWLEIAWRSEMNRRVRQTQSAPFQHSQRSM